MSHKLRVHVIQHVPFEGPALIGDWVKSNGHLLTFSKLYQGAPLPSQRDFDLLVVMGGPMGVNDVEQYPWLEIERRFILESIKSGKCILGICLGAQLIAAALGAKVYKNSHREIGWFEVERSAQLSETILGDYWPESANVFHWHGDTFELPAGAQLIASSEACINQGYILDNRVIGLQFHLEVTPDSVASLIEHCGNELDGSRYVQTEGELMANATAYNDIHPLLTNILHKLEETSQS